MELKEKVKLLEFAYAGVLADAVKQYTKAGILEKVTEEKYREQMLTGKMQAEKMGITQPEEVFTVLSELFNCTRWEITKQTNGFTAVAKHCLLCSLAKKLGAGKPCEIYCLNPMKGMIKGLKPNHDYVAEETLWEGKQCKVQVINN